MALPNNELSPKPPKVTGYPHPVKGPGDLLVDWEVGGVALNDPSLGLDYQLWTLRVVPDGEGAFNFIVSPLTPRRQCCFPTLT